jgi:hypothetical protein
VTLRDRPFGDTSNAATLAVTKHDVSLFREKNEEYFFKLAAKLHVPTQVRWRYLTFRHMGCRATSSIGVNLVPVSLAVLYSSSSATSQQASEFLAAHVT